MKKNKPISDDILKIYSEWFRFSVACYQLPFVIWYDLFIRSKYK